MNGFSSSLLNVFGMFIEPSARKRFEGIDITGQIIDDPKRQLGPRVGKDMFRFIKKGLPVSGIALEESKYTDSRQNQNRDGEDCQSGQRYQTGPLAGESSLHERSQKTNQLVG